MLSKTSRKDVAMDKASDLASAVADAAEAGREKIAPVAQSVVDHLSDAADKASEAAAPHVAKAKEAVADAAAPQVAKAKETTTDAADAAAPHLEQAKKASQQAAKDAADAAAPRVKKARKAAKKAAKQATKDAAKLRASTADAAAPRVKKARKAAKKAAKQASKDAAKLSARTADRAEAAGLTKEQAHRLFADEWMPRIQETIAATAAAGTSAYAALPQQARDAVETVAPQVAKKRRKKGKVFIALGLLAGAGAVALYLSGRQQSGAKAPQITAPEIEKLDVSPVEDSTSVPATDDAVGDLEKKVDSSVSGSRRGRHAAKD